MPQKDQLDTIQRKVGHKLTQHGIKPDDNKGGAMNKMPAPADKKEVERQLGTVNYLGKLIPNLATVTGFTGVLQRMDNEFEWSYEQDQAFEAIKAILTEDGDTVTRFFHVRKPVTISYHASPTGLERVLLQDWTSYKILSYGHDPLTCLKNVCKDVFQIL